MDRADLMGFQFEEETQWQTDELRPNYLQKDDIIKDVVTGRVFRVENQCVIIGRAPAEGSGPFVSSVRGALPGTSSPGSPWKDVGLPPPSNPRPPGQLHPTVSPVPPEPPHGSEESPESPAYLP